MQSHSPLIIDDLRCLLMPCDLCLGVIGLSQIVGAMVGLVDPLADARTISVNENIEFEDAGAIAMTGLV